MATAGEKTRFSILFLLLIAAGATYYLITASQTPVFVGGQTYYMPGQNKNCAWNVYFENDVYLKRGSFSNIHIGLPDRENRGSIKGIVESTENDLLLFLFLAAQEKLHLLFLLLVMTTLIDNLNLLDLSFLAAAF